ncbi:MAG: hypothetical protein RMZ42_26370 [Nostoc sp. DedQUE05]|uniref:hypothetical protein n=1 Tax=Nostoc sp. DedQUE05 TaxID=3075391 RepID=UPI002AD39073|nr:hypothetical protein [Nostoc sp. DedQUE05]MDZ8095440.1 hypothetical protein [Nostoc sp. DedQUE05]
MMNLHESSVTTLTVKVSMDAHLCIGVNLTLKSAYNQLLDIVSFPCSDWECRPRGSASLAGGSSPIEVHFQPRGWKRDLKKLSA